MAEVDQHKVWQSPKLKIANAVSEAVLLRALSEVPDSIRRQIYARMHYTKHNIHERVPKDVATSAKRIHILLARHEHAQSEFRRIFWFTRTQIQAFPKLIDVEPYEVEGESHSSAKTPRKAAHLDNGKKTSEQATAQEGHTNDLAALAKATGIDISKLSPDLREDLRLANPQLVLNGPRYEAATVEAAVRMYRIKIGTSRCFRKICRALGVTKETFWSKCLHMAIGGEESVHAARLAKEEMKLLPVPLRTEGQLAFSPEVKARVLKIHKLLSQGPLHAFDEYFSSIGFPKMSSTVSCWKQEEKKNMEQ